MKNPLRLESFAIVGLILGLYGPDLSAAEAVNEFPWLDTRDLLAVVQASEGTPQDLYPLIRKLGFPGPANDSHILAFEDHALFSCMVGSPAGLIHSKEGQTAGKGESPAHLRRIVFLKPATFLVEDHIPNIPSKRFQGEDVVPLLKSVRKPSIGEKAIRIPGDREVVCVPLLTKVGEMLVRRESGDYFLFRPWPGLLC
jgi:hypothetical protein